MNRFARAALAGLVMTLFAMGCASTKATVPGLHKTSEGLVQSVGQNQFTVAGIEGETAPVKFTVAPDTVIEQNKERVALNQLTPGTPVRVVYETSTGAERAFKVDVLTGGEAAKVRTDVQQRGYGGSGQSK